MRALLAILAAALVLTSCGSMPWIRVCIETAPSAPVQVSNQAAALEQANRPANAPPATP